MGSIFIKVPNRQLYFRQSSHGPIPVEPLGCDNKVEYYNNANQEIMPEVHNIWVKYMQSEENDLDHTFQEPIPSCPVLYISLPPPNQILQFQKHLPTAKAILTFSKWC
jgi:hypothetical protein